MNASAHIHKAMVDLRTGKITPDQFRAIMREAKGQTDQASWDKSKARAVRHDQRSPFKA